MKDPIVDRAFAEKFLTAVDRPFDYGVYLLFHDWWAEAPQEAIDAYAATLMTIPGAQEFVDEAYLAEPLQLADLEGCAEGTLGHAYRSFIVDNDLAENLATDYRAFNEQLTASGTLDRLPTELSYAIVRGFQIHDFLHVLTGFSSKPLGELAQAGFHFGQLRFPYHAFRFAITAGHVAFVAPEHTTDVMDAMCTGWMLGRAAENLHFAKWEEELDTPLADLRMRAGIDPGTYQTV